VTPESIATIVGAAVVGGTAALPVARSLTRRLTTISAALQEKAEEPTGNARLLRDIEQKLGHLMGVEARVRELITDAEKRTRERIDAIDVRLRDLEEEWRRKSVDYEVDIGKLQTELENMRSRIDSTRRMRAVVVPTTKR
jgi:chromosome segregation ATPase